MLFIGNSYTFYNDLPDLLERIAREAGKGRTIEASMEVGSGYSLSTHWAASDALRRIRTRQWDYVVLQESSQGPIEAFARFEEYAGRFAAEIRAAGSTPLLFVTWAPEFMADSQAAITAAYRSVGRAVDARLAPVGPAWQAAHAAPPALQLFDADGTHPAPLGSYLAAAVFYATLFHESPESTAGSADEQRLQRIAWQTVRGFK